MKLKKIRFRTDGQNGYMLLSVMLLITLMIVAMAVELPRISQQIKREKEQELVNRGLGYATAIKRFYHRMGTYPVSLDQLENTNNLRFLRKRYKDPMTAEGEWRLIHVGEAQIKFPNPAQPGANPIASPTPSGSAGGLSPSGTAGGLGSGTGTPTTGLSGGSGQGFGTPAGQAGTLNTQGTGPGLGGSGGGGGGPIIGVASMSKKTSIKEFNGENEYDHWLFVYDPKAEQAGGPGVFVASPTAAGSATATPSPGAQPAGSPGATPQPTPTPNPSMPQ